MENAGLKVIALQYGTMDDLETWIRIISSLYQQEERGEELIDYFYAQVAEVSDRVATLNTSEFRSILQLSDNLKVAGQGFGYYLWDNIGGYRWDPPGVETPLTIKWMAKIQHPELFADMDMETELRDFYQEMYGFTLTDEMVVEILGDTQN